MEDLIKAVYNNMGLAGIAIIILILGFWEISKFIMVSYFDGKLYFKSMRRYFSFLPFDRKVDFTHHKIFQQLNLITINIVPKLNIMCPMRKRLFSDMVIFRTNFIKTTLLQFIKEVKFQSMDTVDFKFEIQCLISKLINNWNIEAEKDFPNVAIKKFNEKFLIYNQLMETLALEHCDNDKTYSSIDDKLDAILNDIAIIEHFAIQAIEVTLNSLNGELTKTEYKNIKCSRCDEDCKNAAHPHDMNNYILMPRKPAILPDNPNPDFYK